MFGFQAILMATILATPVSPSGVFEWAESDQQKDEDSKKADLILIHVSGIT